MGGPSSRLPTRCGVCAHGRSLAQAGTHTSGTHTSGTHTHTQTHVCLPRHLQSCGQRPHFHLGAHCGGPAQPPAHAGVSKWRSLNDCGCFLQTSPYCPVNSIPETLPTRPQGAASVMQQLCYFTLSELHVPFHVTPARCGCVRERHTRIICNHGFLIENYYMQSLNSPTSGD